MPAGSYSLRAQTLETLIRFKRPEVPLWVVVRNTAAVVLPLGIGIAAGHVAIGLGVGAGALDVMFSDQPGPYRQRIVRMLLAALAGALAALCGFLFGDQWLPMLLATLILGFGGGMLVVFGTDLARVGMTSMILLVITAASPMPTLAAALGGAGLILAGSLLLGLFSVAAWPLQRYRPERHALAVVYRGLAELARQTAHDDHAAPALTEAMTTLQQTLLGRHRAHGRAMEAFGVLLELAERIRLELMAMIELHADHTAHAGLREDAARVLQGVAQALEQGDSPHAAARTLQRLRAALQGQPGEGLLGHLHALAGQLAAAVRNVDWAGSRGEERAAAAETRLPRALRGGALLATLGANLGTRSVAFRHAVRMAVCLSLALLASRLFALPHGYWLPMTAAIVLRPDYAATFSFGLLRVVGTVLGLLLTTALLYITPNQPWAHLALMAVLCMVFRYLAGAHYGIAVAALTGTVVILLSFDGVAPATAVSDRVLNTVLGCGMALLAYVAWPTWERGRARAALTRLLASYADYLAALAQPAQRAAQRETRSAARTARSNAQASLERMRTEPATPPALLALAHALLGNSHRLARAAMAFEALLAEPGTPPARAPATAFVAQVALALRELASALHERRAARVPPLRAAQRALATQLAATEGSPQAEWLHVCDRLTDAVNTLAHVIARSPQAVASDDRVRDTAHA